MNGLGYIELSKGKTGGSRTRFYKRGHKPIDFHKPHPSPYLKAYAIKDLIDQLEKEGLI